MQIDDLFSKIKNLPVIPALMAELLNSFDDENARIEQIAKKISMDQVISAKVLKMANSAAYRRGNEVTSIDQAVIRLGFNAVRSLVVASSIATAFPKTPGFKREEFWATTFQVATIAKALAKHTNVAPESAFTCALMHNIGELVIQTGLPEDSAMIGLSMEQGASRVKAQREVLGFDYAQVGEALAERWNFSDLFKRAIREQLDPLAYDPVSSEAVLIRLSVFVNFAWNAGVPAEAIVGRFPKALAQHLHFEPAELAGQLESLHDQGNELARMLGS